MEKKQSRAEEWRGSLVTHKAVHFSKTEAVRSQIVTALQAASTSTLNVVVERHWENKNLFNLAEWVMQRYQKPRNGCLLLQGALDDTEKDDVFQRAESHHAIDWPVKRSLCNKSQCSVLHYV